MHICSICLRLDVSLLTEIYYLQIEPCEKGTHSNETIILKRFYLYEIVIWTECIWWALENNYFLVYKLFEFATEWIPTIRNKAGIIFCSKSYLHYCILVYYAAHFNLLFILSSFFRVALFSYGIHNERKKKLTSHYVYI